LGLGVFPLRALTSDQPPPLPETYSLKLASYNFPISNLGGGSPLTIVAAFQAEPSAEMSLILPNVSPTLSAKPPVGRLFRQKTVFAL